MEVSMILLVFHWLLLLFRLLSRNNFFNEVPHVDGGVLFASPLTGLQDVLVKISAESLHITYINIFNINSDNPDQEKGEVNNILNVGTFTFDELVKSLIVQDRLVGINLVKNNTKKTRFLQGTAKYGILKELEQMISSSKFSLLELYPEPTEPLELTRFSGEDVLKMMETIKNNFFFRLWWG